MEARRRARVGVLLAACSATSCEALEPAPLPPRGEVLVVVDTDLPVPLVVSRLRIDVTTEDGTRVASRDDARPDARDWPTSFSVYSDDEARPRTLLVRLRAYPDARVGPSGEPDPTVSVDRTVTARLAYGTRGRMRVTLRGACLGRASCPEAGPDPVVEPTLDRPTTSEMGTYERSSCDGVTAGDGKVCIPGGAFLLGDAFFRPPSTEVVAEVDARPERLVVVSRHLVDRDEVTVSRFRAAVSRGFLVPRAVLANEKDGPPDSTLPGVCTWSATPRGREDYPLSCVTWDTARAFCAFEGGDLPTEAQWEWTAVAAGRTRKVTYPWGDEPPTCARAVYGRGVLDATCAPAESDEGLPPASTPNGDVTALGVRNLAGSVAEHVRDSFAPFGDPCWTNAPRRDPLCELPIPPECAVDVDTFECRVTTRGIVKSTRGAAWIDSAFELRAVDRRGGNRISKEERGPTGFRCVYPAP